MTDMWGCLALFSVGALAGFLNILAGGGSLLTLPVLILLGLPPTTANGTNRIAILVQNVVAGHAFWRQKQLPWKLVLVCTPPALLGAWWGAQVAVELPGELFEKILGGIMLGVLVLMAWDPKRHVDSLPIHSSNMQLAVLGLAFVVIGFYGGFVQAGVGFLILVAVLLAGLDLVQGNALKIVVIFCFNLPALVVFAWHGHVHWGLGAALALGNAVGGYVASHMALSRGHAWIRKVVMAVVATLAVVLLLW